MNQIESRRTKINIFKIWIKINKNGKYVIYIYIYIIIIIFFFFFTFSPWNRDPIIPSSALSKFRENDTLNSIPFPSLLNLQSPRKRNTEKNNTKIFRFSTNFHFPFCFSPKTGHSQLIFVTSRITTRAPSEFAAGTGCVSASRIFRRLVSGYFPELCIDLDRPWLGMSSSSVRPCEVLVRSWSFWFLGLSASPITP